MKVSVIKLERPEDVARLKETLDSLGVKDAMEQVEDDLDRIRTHAPRSHEDAVILDALMAGFEAASRDYLEGAPLRMIISTATEQLQRSVAGTMSAFMCGVITLVNAVSAADRADAEERKGSEQSEYTIVEDVVRCRCGSVNCHKTIMAERLNDGRTVLIMQTPSGKDGAILDKEGAVMLAKQLLEAAEVSS